MEERTVTRTQASGTVRLRDSLNAVFPRVDDGMNDAHSRDTSKRCVYRTLRRKAAFTRERERERYAAFTRDSDVFGFKSRVMYKFKIVLRKQKKDYFSN